MAAKVSAPDNELYFAMDALIDHLRAAVLIDLENGKRVIKISESDARRLLALEAKYRRALHKKR